MAGRHGGNVLQKKKVQVLHRTICDIEEKPDKSLTSSLAALISSEDKKRQRKGHW